MKNLIFKGNKYSYLLILLVLILISSWFYWYELRPVKIRQECSWVKHTTDAIPAKPAMNKDELRVADLIETCREPETKEETRGYQPLFSGYGISQYRECVDRNNKIIEEYKTARPAVPAKDWYSKAPEKVYDFCIKSKGITR